jgi:hypothetical protein
MRADNVRRINLRPEKNKVVPRDLPPVGRLFSAGATRGVRAIFRCAHAPRGALRRVKPPCSYRQFLVAVPAQSSSVRQNVAAKNLIT